MKLLLRRICVHSATSTLHFMWINLMYVHKTIDVFHIHMFLMSLKNERDVSVHPIIAAKH